MLTYFRKRIFALFRLRKIGHFTSNRRNNVDGRSLGLYLHFSKYIPSGAVVLVIHLLQGVQPYAVEIMRMLAPLSSCVLNALLAP